MSVRHRAARRGAALALVALATTATAVAAPVDPGLPNGSFEAGVSGWSAYRARVAQVAVPDAPDGAHVARVTATGSRDFTIDDAPAAVAAAAPGATYRGRASVRAASPSSVGRTVRLRLREGDGSRYLRTVSGPSVKLGTEFQAITAELTPSAPGNVVDLYVVHRGVPGGAFDIDAVALTDDAPAAPGGDGPPGAGGPGGTPAEPPPLPVPTDPAVPAPVLPTVTTLASGLVVPWAIDVAPDGAIYLTERPGRVRVVRDGVLDPRPLVDLGIDRRGEGGLLGIALHPGFPATPHVYLYVTSADADGRLTGRVERHALDPSGVLTGRAPILTGLPAAVRHDGGAIAFGPDGMLYVTTGDAVEPALAADPGSLAGKILRVAPDGSVPEGNPFGSPVWSLGHRNPQGLAWDAAGRLFSSEHGPTGEFGLCCRDELNLITPGGDYGWPRRAGSAPAGPAAPADGASRTAIDPAAESEPGATWAPAGLAYLPGPRPSLVTANLRGQELRRFRIDAGDPSRITGQEVALSGLGRLRGIHADAGGCLLVTTSNRDGRGTPAADDDRLLRVCLPD